LETVGWACESFLDRTIRDIKTDSLQLDELWGRVGCRQARTTAADKERGDFFTFLAIDRRTKLIVSHYTGKRNYESTDEFVKDLASRVSDIVQITCDAFRPYPAVIRKHLLYRLNLAVMQKIYKTPDGRFTDDLDVIDPLRRYSPPRCVGVKLEIRAGDPDVDKITTSHVERLNLSVRTFNRRFTRLCLGYSRKLANHRYSVALFVAAYNFCKRHSTLGCSPAVGQKLTDHTWTVAELVQRVSETS
jgi:IS1 family transposase